MVSARTTFSSHHVERLEAWIDKLDEELPELKNFILPVSSSICSLLLPNPVCAVSDGSSRGFSGVVQIFVRGCSVVAVINELRQSHPVT